MVSLDDIKNVTFKKASFGGYKPFEVDTFIDSVHSSYKMLEDENKSLRLKVEELNRKLEKYQMEEGSIRKAILSAQKLADSSINSADNKSKSIILDASKRADDMISQAKDEVERQKEIAWNLRVESENFRRLLVEKYENQLKMLRQSVESEKYFSKIESDLNEKIKFNTQQAEKSDPGSDELDKSNIFEVEFNKGEASSQENLQSQGGEVLLDSGAFKETDGDCSSSSGIFKERNTDLRFGERYRSTDNDSERGMYSGLFRRKK